MHHALTKSTDHHFLPYVSPASASLEGFKYLSLKILNLANFIETVPLLRWVGVIVITIGVALIGFS